MSDNTHHLSEFHWLIEMVQTIEVGIVVLDRNYNIKLWNGFMENHSGVSPNILKDQNLFQHFADLDTEWLKKKMESVFLLKNRAFISWEQRPFVFCFKNYRPITGRAAHMYQNVTLQPLVSLTGEVSHISMIIYDVTDIAMNKLQLNNVNQTLEHLSQTDELTQLNNRRHWQHCMEREYERFSRYNTASSLVMLDIDHFKSINDRFGHQIGDVVIQRVAHMLSQSLRETDCAGRYGGEEFAVVLANTNSKDAISFTERLRKRVEQVEFMADDDVFRVTVSFGICDLNDDIKDSISWLSFADKALYRAKLNGRNRSVIYRDISGDEKLH
ncbi:sensor domain-containing diguanylate cyclase [Parashewanella spongiae]|uniref:diguanylate cyclase n=1 Tax=Parashewanella spongiae TaxID=342950 RepID=A0A3A6TU78_9GAMM|nr:sensor domain-containing diguanylate cyclase [Parashewanella spongiae]MCL1079741.1 sensor domain-containing diguanylate cyclase [Parashewanella spongiae]RJY15121.1 sensor domain-containing diguanylate cyclase [Parashewanella spongiae]